MDKFDPKNQNCGFKIQVGASTNLNMLNAMRMFTLSILDQKYPFWENVCMSAQATIN